MQNSETFEEEQKPELSEKKKAAIAKLPKGNHGLDWRIGFVKDLAIKCRDIGLLPHDRNFHAKTLYIFYEQAALDRERPESQRIGYARAADMYEHPMAKSQIVNLVRKHWPVAEELNWELIPVDKRRPNGRKRGSQAKTPGYRSVPVEVPDFKKYDYEEPFQTVVSVVLSAAYHPEFTRKSLEEFLQSRFSDYDLTIPEIQVLENTHFDLLISHSGYASEILDGLRTVPWISDAFLKPFSEYGVAVVYGVTAA